MNKKAPNHLHEQLDNAYAEGYLNGRDDMSDKFKPAISDGLRNGSSKCAQEMSFFKKRKI